MNYIKINEDIVSLIESDENIIVSLSDKLDIFDIVKLEINVLKDTSICIDHTALEESKLDIEIKVNEGVNVHLYDVKQTDDLKIQYKYFLSNASSLNIEKFYKSNNIKELDIVYLDGESSKINYNVGTINKYIQDFRLFVYHNASNTISNVSCNGINLAGKIGFNMTEMVYSDILGSVIEYNNHIIDFDSNSLITPNFITEGTASIKNDSTVERFNNIKIDKTFLINFFKKNNTYNEYIEKILKNMEV